MKNNWQKPLTLSGLALIMLGLAWLMTPPQRAQAQQPAPTPPARILSISGLGMASVRPDVAVVTIGVQTAAAEAGAALGQNNEQMQAVVAALQATGVVSDDIQTQTVQLQPQTPVPAPDQPPQPVDQTAVTGTLTATGYIATNLVEVRVRDLTTLGNMLDSATQAGGNRIQGIRFEVSDPAAALDEARQMAWENARSSAERLAQLAGVTLGSVVQLSEFSSVPTAPPPVADVRFAEASVVPVSPGAQQVTVNLQVIWALGE